MHPPIDHPGRPGATLPSWLPVGSVVRRGRGKALWRVTGLTNNLITLEPVEGYTNATVPLPKADTLTVLSASSQEAPTS